MASKNRPRNPKARRQDELDTYEENQSFEKKDSKISSIEACSEAKQVGPDPRLTGKNKKIKKRNKPFINCFGIKIE
tara:strand:- start:1833 stop:2060 length:228 start_codon:yes stop_codon:yes gene_type:complete